MSTNQDELEEKLTLNIGLMAKQLQKAGYCFSDIDTICDEALAFIQNRAEKITINNPLQTQNVENVIIMVLMHGAIMSQKEFIKDTAKNLKMDIKTIESKMIKDTMDKK